MSLINDVINKSHQGTDHQKSDGGGGGGKTKKKLFPEKN